MCVNQSQKLQKLRDQRRRRAEWRRGGGGMLCLSEVEVEAEGILCFNTGDGNFFCLDIKIFLAKRRRLSSLAICFKNSAAAASLCCCCRHSCFSRFRNRCFRRTRSSPNGIVSSLSVFVQGMGGYIIPLHANLIYLSFEDKKYAFFRLLNERPM